MDERVKISVIVPVYNIETYLEKCVDSILEQTIKEIEVILVDDGSEDGSGRICDRYAEKDPRVIVIHKKNGGLSSARNAGIKKASGEYIGFVDGDDWIGRSMYELLYRSAVNTGAEIAVCRYAEVFQESSAASGSGTESVMEKEEALKAFFLRNISESVWDKIFLRDLWENRGFRTGEINEDTEVICHLLMDCQKIVFLDSTQYFYRKRDGSITKSGYTRKFRIVIKHLDQIQAEIERQFPELIPYMKYFFGVHYYCLLISVLKSQNTKQYREDYKEYQKKFFSAFWQFMRWGTGKNKDRILAVLLRCHCGFLIKMAVER